MMIFKKIISVSIIYFSLINILSAEKFTYKYYSGSKQIIEASISGKQFKNKKYQLDYSQHSKTVRIIKEIRDGKALIQDVNCIYYQNKTSNNKVNKLKDAVTVNYLKDKLGNLTIFDNAIYPALRNVPVFPDEDMEPGFKWTAKAAEIQNIFGDKIISVIPATVNYTFLGYENIDNRKLAKFKYDISIDIGNNNNMDKRILHIIGITSTIMYFDNSLGSPVKETYKRDYSFLLNESTKKYTVSFVDSGSRIWQPAELTNKDNLIDEIRKKISDDNIKDTEVSKDNKSIKIRLENIRFFANSSLLLQEEKLRIKMLADILKNYKDKKIIIIGHTALAGTKEERFNLSIERARAVALYLIKLDAIDPSNISILGKGATEPITDNNTEEGKNKNRRVEIVILEK